MSWGYDDEERWQKIPETVKKTLAGLPSTAKVLVQHLLSLEAEVKKQEKAISTATKAINSARFKQSKTLDEITELKQMLVSTYKLNVDTMRVIDKL